jgi:hypothetical protein
LSEHLFVYILKLNLTDTYSVISKMKYQNRLTNVLNSSTCVYFTQIIGHLMTQGYSKLVNGLKSN